MSDDDDELAELRAQRAARTGQISLVSRLHCLPLATHILDSRSLHLAECADVLASEADRRRSSRSRGYRFR
jgi:hypothetical protein